MFQNLFVLFYRIQIFNTFYRRFHLKVMKLLLVLLEEGAVVVVVVANWRVGLRKALVSPESSSVTPLVNRASSSSLVFDTRLRRLLTLFTARSQVSRNGLRIYIFLQERAQDSSKDYFHSYFRIIGVPFAQQS